MTKTHKATLFVTATAAALLLSACTRMDQFFDGTVVNVEETEVLVRPLRGQPGTYQAVPNEASRRNIFLRDPAVSVRNVKAIEMATGCTVYRESIDNNDTSTLAAVDCS